MELHKIREELMAGKNLDGLPLRVTFYARVSTDSDVQLNSLDNQSVHFEEYIKKNPNWIYVNGYIDEGVSGSSVKRRVQFLKMIDDAKKGKFDYILTKSISRFARDTLDSISYTRELLSSGIPVFFQSDNINTALPDSELRLTIMASIAQDDLRRSSESLKFGFEKAISKGRVLGSNRITGYKKDDGKLVIDEDKAQVVRKIFELYATGEYGLTKLALVLEYLGYLNLNGKIYDKATLTGIISNPKYKGYYRARTTRTLDYRTKKRLYLCEDDWVTYKDENIPSIVSEELWDKANAFLNARRLSFKYPTTNKEMYRKYTYSGIIYCKEHGVTFQRSTGSRKKKRPLWLCGDYVRYQTKGCQSPRIAECDLDNIMASIMEEIFTDKEGIIKAMSSYYSGLDRDDSYNKEIDKLLHEIAFINKKKDKLLELCVLGIKSNDEYELENNHYTTDIREVKRKIDQREKDRHITSINQTTIENKIREQLVFKENLYPFVKAFVNRIIISKINGDRSDIQIDIYLSNHQNSIKNEKSATEFISDARIETLEKDKRKSFVMNKFKYSVYL